MKRAFPILIVLLFLLQSCEKDELTGKCFRGYYHPCEKMSIEFRPNSRIDCRISSNEFVGHFSDRICGYYEYARPYVSIEWNRPSLGNDVYTNKPTDPDSVIVNSSLDALRLYEGEQEYILLVASPDSIVRNIFVFIIDHLIPIVLFLLALLLFTVLAIRKWYKETGA